MFDELRYRWALRTFLKEHGMIRRNYDQAPNDPETPNFDKHASAKS
jgi:hypothetical protein